MRLIIMKEMFSLLQIVFARRL